MHRCRVVTTKITKNQYVSGSYFKFSQYYSDIMFRGECIKNNITHENTEYT